MARTRVSCTTSSHRARLRPTRYRQNEYRGWRASSASVFTAPPSPRKARSRQAASKIGRKSSPPSPLTVPWVSPSIKLESLSYSLEHEPQGLLIKGEREIGPVSLLCRQRGRTLRAKRRHCRGR